ncbi:MAG: long-chain fatty acid--CoA ligase [Planctomycetota bacterium]
MRVLMIERSSRPVLIRELRESMAAHGDRVALIGPGRGGSPHQAITYRELLRDSSALALGFEQRGLRKGDRVAIIAENSPNWLLADLALLSLGAIVVPRGEEASADELAFILRHSGVRTVLLSRPSLVARLSQHPQLDIGILDGVPLEGDSPGPHVFTLEEVLREGLSLHLDHERELERSTRALEPHDPAAIVYTSGTTGRPKGVVLTHSNLGSNLDQLRGVIDFLGRGDIYLSLLPTWHAFECMVEYVILLVGGTIIYTDRRHLREDLKTWRPHAFAAVPRVWMMLRDGILAAIQSLPRIRRLVVRSALGVALARARDLSVRHRGEASRLHRWRASVRALALTPAHVLARKLVLQPLLREAGLERLVRGAGVSGGGSLPLHVDEFFAALSVPLLNGYGLTETSPAVTMRIPEANHLGTVGRELPLTELRLINEEGRSPAHGLPGRILVRGPQVMSGYWEDEGATAAVLDEEGWFDTGDIGRRTPLGDLVIAGRLKDTIVLLNGENVEPEPIENSLLESPLIRQVMVVGQDRKHLGALIVPSPALPPVQAERLIRAEIERRISARNGFRSHERIQAFTLLESEFSTQDGTLSATLKMRRHRIAELYGPMIERLFNG